MSYIHSVPKIYGMILIILGVIFFVPLLGFIVELFSDLQSQQNNWSIIMVAWTITSMVITIFMMAFGTDIVWYHDKKVNDTTLEEKAEQSKYKPKGEEE